MRSPFWPAVLSGAVAPGIGQIFNKEYGKGILLLTASIGSFLWFSKTITERLSLLLPGTPDQWIRNQELLTNAATQLVNENGGLFLTFQALILLTWLFGIIDAYITAKRKRILPPLPDDTDSRPLD